MKQSPCIVCKILTALVIVGALNWGLVGIAHTDLVARALGDMTIAARIVYGLIGLAGLIKIISIIKPCPCCKTSEGG